eukprot:TRINITY_DN4346_c0_g1_i1.p1 TRINITY_DN4346_c0_g1~~TRINITY_DN4346_c0_g1_i1.p1  ORF type:complete len:327 (+),score=120.17 TRINITY_DN4346_c0_g1_i1:145-1125(+)
MCGPQQLARVGSISERYQVDPDGELGDGAYARVVAATEHSTGACRALKIIDKCGPTQAPADAQELAVLQRLKHPNVIQLHDAFETPGEVVMVFDRMRTDLYAVMEQRPRNQLTETEARAVARQLLSALAYLHSEGIVHRDIKPENVLLNSVDDVRLADFGFARAVGEADNDPVGTSFYMPPEAVRALPPLQQHRSAMQRLSAAEAMAGDVWSLGVVLHFVLSGRPPFTGRLYPPTERRRLLGMMDAGPQFAGERWAGSSDAACGLVRSMLAADWRQRITAAEALMHPWLHYPVLPAPPRPPSGVPTDMHSELPQQVLSLTAVGCPA